MLNFLNKSSKQNHFLSKFARKERNRRYYLRHRDEILEKRRKKYRLFGE
jgi:hypothetical protein